MKVNWLSAEPGDVDTARALMGLTALVLWFIGTLVVLIASTEVTALRGIGLILSGMLISPYPRNDEKP